MQDYHLALTPRQLRERRPDLRIGHFSHTPWAPPEYFCLLPDAVAREVLLGLLGADAVGFHSARWADAFGRCCEAVLGATWESGHVRYRDRTTRVSVHPLGVDAEELRAFAASPEVQGRLPLLREIVGDRQLVLRIDRTELSKNIVRGLEAYRELLRTRPEWHERVVHLAFAYPSRHDLPDYRAYTGVVQRVAREVNEEFARPGWVPVHLEVRDDYPRSVAAYSLADVLLVNPLRDGMNLVAKEGPVLSERGVSLVLSRQAGAADELGADAHLVNPYDVGETARALHEALSTPAGLPGRALGPARAGRDGAAARRLAPVAARRPARRLSGAPYAPSVLTLTAVLRGSARYDRHGIVRLPQQALAALGAADGSVLRMRGRRTTAAIAVTAEGCPPGSVLCDELVLSNLRLRDGEPVEVEVADRVEAVRLTVSGPAGVSRSLEPAVLRTALLGKVVTAGDQVSLRPSDLAPPVDFARLRGQLTAWLGAGWTSEVLHVTGTEPQGPVLVTMGSVTGWQGGTTTTGEPTPEP